ncbi:MAG TPA: alkane 1-monooxygenase [Myxococcales bacterium]|nr:alkane 1-monooxygenase [Deltaproteobacteria bacterium]MBU49204.1 alkane 1-monooxygenase [Deltaproteobacteria bacterium]HAA55533.1 alkane 1-monooxygenase [Myxococcales bacterium]|tara:strand:+ start:12104 stop:13180 length:1077 start_codon:yes stop_codon:yes gene_type:complete
MFRYLLSLIFIPLTISSIVMGGWWSFCVPLVAFVLIPTLELLLPIDVGNMSKEEEERALSSKWFSYILYAIVPLHWAVVIFYLYSVSLGQMTWLHWLGATSSVGILCGAYGINVAHELGHRKKKHEQWFSKILLLSSLYMHFFIEHNRGHHKHVATEADPASARYGEVLYAFWFRSVVMGYISAWKIESTRLSKKKLPWYHWSNEMLSLQLIQLAALGLTYAFFDVFGLLSFLAIATIGFLLLETINYIEHYGLTRKRKQNGRYESVLPIHSWNSDHALGRMLLFELTRHSDHHAHASRKYQVLRHFDESPQLPTGYPGMMVLSLFPPIWFWVMHRHIDAYKEQLEGQRPIPTAGQTA